MLSKSDLVENLPYKTLFRCSKDASIKEVLQGLHQQNAGAAILEGADREQPLVISEHNLLRALASRVSLSDPALSLASHVPCVMGSLALEKLPETILQYDGILIFFEEQPLGFVSLDSLSAILTNLQRSSTHISTDEKLSSDLGHSLQVIRTCCEYILTEEADKIPKTTTEFVQRIRENSSLAEEMLRQLSKTDIWSHQGAQLSYGIHVGQMIQSWAVDLRMITFEKKQNLLLDINRDIKVTADSGRLRSILQNMVEYISRYSAQGVDLHLSTQWSQGNAIIEVQAPGDTHEDIPSIGQNYPLRIARHLVEELNGVLTTDDHENFIISAKIPDAILIENAEEHPSPLKILVVDDEPDILDFVTHSLSSYTVEILKAANGKEGLDLFVKHHPDLILSDIKMPDMDGLQLLNRIKAQSRHSLVILSSGFYLNINEDLSHNMFQADRVLPKPYSSDELINCINRSLILHDHTPLTLKSAAD